MQAAIPTAPRSLREVLPWLWTRVLFPGAAAPVAGRPSWPAVCVLLLLPGVLLYPCLSFYLFEPDEGRYAQIPREMLQRGDWVVPHLLAEPYLDKPPLCYWLVMVSYRVFGVHDWAARLVPALALHAAILLTYLLGRRSLGERTVLLGAVLLTLAPGFLGMGRLLLLDGLLTLWVTLALFSGFEAVRGGRWGWRLLAAVACGLGVLTKGPVILLLLVPPLWLYRRLQADPAPLTWRALALCAAVVLALPLPWYVAVCARSPEFAYHFFWEHNVVRFLTPFDHEQPVWFYGPIMLWGLLPASLLVWPFLRFLGSGAPDAARHRDPALGFFLLAGGWCVLFFSLSGCKLPTYVLPAFPPLALAFGRFLTSTRWGRGPVLGGLVALGLVLQIAGHYVVVPWYAAYRSPAEHWPQLARHCGDRDTPVLCYPRAAHSVAFYLDRDDLRNFRSKDIAQLIAELRANPRTVVLCTHRHSLEGLKHFLPADLRVAETTHFGLKVPGLTDAVAKQVNRRMGETALGLCDLAVIERVAAPATGEVEAEEPLRDTIP